MQNIKQQVAETTGFIKSRIKDAPYVGLLTGTGLGESAESMTIDTTIRYEDIPFFPRPTVQTHIGRLLAGNMNECPLVAMHITPGWGLAARPIPR